MKKHENRLIREKSPYLLQHASNPVDWYPWGEEALARAREENKPIFLSIGYSTCHWCHVMARESFENPEIAAILNRWFVCIKVDREERPDIDRFYMTAVQVMTGRGGWPLSVFLTPDGKPFFGGTYFPPQSTRGLPGFGELLQIIHETWQTKRDKVTAEGRELCRHISANAKAQTRADVGQDVLKLGFESFAASFDGTHGGFGPAPKFPRPVVFNFLFRLYRRTGNDQARDMVLSTLRHMAAGGIHDHLGGGFHRYSVDAYWRVPHFEKMLYDQAQLAHSYLDALQITRDPFFGHVATGILEYVLRDMTHAEGGFYSAEDADSPLPENPAIHEEGAFYTWRAQEIEELLDTADARIFSLCYGIKPEGNVTPDPTNEFKGKNILYRAKTDQEAAELLQIDPDQVRKSLQRSREKLFDQRHALRPRPHLDDKVITAWNGLMIGALARGSRVLGQKEKRYQEAAVAAAFFIRKYLYVKETKTLLRRYRDGEAALPGQLDDYAFLTAGLLELYQATGDSDWLLWAEELTTTQIQLFWDQQGGFFDSAPDATIPTRMKSHHDGAEPAGNSVAAGNLLLLSGICNREKWHTLAEQTIEAVGESLQKYPTAMPQMLAAVDQLFFGHQQVVIAGKRGSEDTEAMIQTVYSSYQPGLILLVADGGKNQHQLASWLPSIESMTMKQGRATAYFCKNFTCQEPTTEPKELYRLLTGE